MSSLPATAEKTVRKPATRAKRRRNQKASAMNGSKLPNGHAQDAAKQHTAPDIPAPAAFRNVDLPLSRIVGPSPRNVRTTPSSDESITEIAATISHHGLLSALVVEPETPDADPGQPDTRFVALTGGRRLAGLQLLARDPESGINGDTAIRCRIPVIRLSDSDATAISVAENESRVPLNPIDASDAYRTLRRSGLTIDDIAAIFGITLRKVRSSLLLQALHPDIRNAGRKDALTLGRLQAYASCSDQARQVELFRSIDPETPPAEIRQHLHGEGLTASSPVMRLIGIDQYRAAGGTFQPDLFTREDGSEHFEDSLTADPQLAYRLANADLTQQANRLSATRPWGWTRTYLTQQDYVLDSLHWTQQEPADGEEFTDREIRRLGIALYIDNEGSVQSATGLVDPTFQPLQTKTAASTTAVPAARDQKQRRPANAGSNEHSGESDNEHDGEPVTLDDATLADIANPDANTDRQTPTPNPVNASLAGDLLHIRRSRLCRHAIDNSERTAAWAVAENILVLASPAHEPLVPRGSNPAPAIPTPRATHLFRSESESAPPRSPATPDCPAVAETLLPLLTATPEGKTLCKTIATAYAAAITADGTRNDVACLAFAEWTAFDWASWRPPLAYWLRIHRTELSHYLASFLQPNHHDPLLRACSSVSHRELCETVHQAAETGESAGLSAISCPEPGLLADRLNETPVPGFVPITAPT